MDRTMFETADMSKVKRYAQIEFNKMLADDVNYKDFIFAKEVKLGTYVYHTISFCFSNSLSGGMILT